MIAEALTVADSVSAADCAPQVGSPTHLWLQIIQAAGGIATTIGVLIANLIRDTRESSAEHEHHLAQLETIRRVKLEQFAAQARKLVPSSVRTPLLGDL